MRKAREWLLALVGGLYTSGAESCGYLRRLGIVGVLLLVAAPAFGQARIARMVAGSYGAPAINDTMSADATGALNSNPATHTFTAESTGVFNTGGYRHLTLFMRVITAGGDTSSTASFAIAVKCFPTDTGATSTIADSMACVFTPPQVPSAATGPDSTAAAYSTSGPPAGTGTGVFPGEFVESFDPTLGRATKSNRFFSINGRAIPLASRVGVPDFAGCTYMQIRIRLLRYAALGVKPRVQCWVVGSN